MRVLDTKFCILNWVITHFKTTLGIHLKMIMSINTRILYLIRGSSLLLIILESEKNVKHKEKPHRWIID